MLRNIKEPTVKTENTGKKKGKEEKKEPLYHKILNHQVIIKSVFIENEFSVLSLYTCKSLAVSVW